MGKLTGFLGNLLSGGGTKSVDKEPERSEGVDHNGYTIYAAPKPSGSQWNLAGVVAKEIDGEQREHAYIRADTYTSKEDAEKFSIAKGRQLVDERGDKLFD
ncbi:MAG: HlyU family transcriptional regulator [Pseudomonadota bacterium]